MHKEGTYLLMNDCVMLLYVVLLTDAFKPPSEGPAVLWMGQPRRTCCSTAASMGPNMSTRMHLVECWAMRTLLDR